MSLVQGRETFKAVRETFKAVRDGKLYSVEGPDMEDFYRA